MSNLPPEGDDERRARELAETVKQEASGVSETVREEAGGVTEQAEERAADRVIQRAEERLEERIESRADIQGELHDITEAVNTLLVHMDQSLPDERVKAILEAAKAEEKRSRRKLAVSIIGPVLVVGAIAAGSWNQGRTNNRQNENVEIVANYVQHCLQGKTEGLTTTQIQAECGGGSADGQATAVKALFCVLLTQPDVREKSLLSDCVQRVEAGEFG